MTVSRDVRPAPPLSVETARALIRASFPAIDSSGVQYLGSGWEFDTFLTRDDWVFRFPREQESATLFEAEARVHRLVEPVLPSHVRVPRVELEAQPTPAFPYAIAGHRYISGIPADALSPEHLPRLAREIALVLGALHSIPEREARAAGMREGNANDDGSREWVVNVLEVAARLPAIDAIVDRAVASLGNTVSSLPAYHGPLQLIHQDLGTDHILVNAGDGSLVGILDWTDAILGDAARDFVFLLTWQGWGFAEEVLRHYPRAVDEAFGARVRAMAKFLSAAWLALEWERGSQITEQVRAVHNAYAANHPPRLAIEPGTGR